jgi:ribonuclease P/MRP protein subunit RPP40
MVFISAKYFLIARMLVILLCTNMLIMKAPIIQPKINKRSKDFFGNEATLLTSKILKMSKYSFWISTTLPASFFMPTINSRKTEKLKSIKIHNSIEHIFVTEIYILTILSKIGIKKTILFRIVSLLSKIFVHIISRKIVKRSTFLGESYSRPVRVHSGVPQGSVLGPLLFIAYTADLGCILRSPFAMYADDIKLYNISNQSMALDWLLPLNSDKCGVLHIGNTNPKHIYRINGKELASFDNYRDLGVTVSFDLSWSNHILKITKKANSILFLLNKVFRKSSPAIFAKLYKTYVRPVLEFANCVWTPVLQRDIQLLESVQRRATRVPFGRSRPQYTARLSLMGIPSLSARRVRRDLLVVFRALSSEQSPIRHLFTLHEGGRTRGHSLKLLKDRFVTTARQYFLTNRIFDQWNSLPPEIVNCKTADSFKAKYDSLLKSRPPDGP